MQRRKISQNYLNCAKCYSFRKEIRFEKYRLIFSGLVIDKFVSNDSRLVSTQCITGKGVERYSAADKHLLPHGWLIVVPRRLIRDGKVLFTMTSDCIRYATTNPHRESVHYGLRDQERFLLCTLSSNDRLECYSTVKHSSISRYHSRLSVDREVGTNKRRIFPGISN